MRNILLIVSILLLTGCQDSLKFWEDKVELEDKKSKKEPKKVDSNDSIKYTKEQKDVKIYFELYLQQLRSLDTDGIISMTYPQLFIPINRTLFRQYVNTLLTSEYISIDSFDANITYIDNVQSYSKGKFVQLRYYSTIKLIFIDPELYNNELSIRVLNDILSSKYGEENIAIEPENRVITIKKEEKLLGIKEGENDWKFIGDNQEYRRLYPRILPMDILSQI
jgi:hypothetical protein